MSDKVVHDSNMVPLNRGDKVFIVNDASFNDGENGIIIKIKSEDEIIWSPDSDPEALMWEAAYHLIKVKGPGTRDDYKDELTRLAKENVNLKERIEILENMKGC